MRLSCILLLAALMVAGCKASNGQPVSDLSRVDELRRIYVSALQIVNPLLEANNHALAKAIPDAERRGIIAAIHACHNGLDEAETYAKQKKKPDFDFVIRQVQASLDVITAFRLQHQATPGGATSWVWKRSSPLAWVRPKQPLAYGKSSARFKPARSSTRMTVTC